MGYSIIFETKIINLKDGRILHLDLSGCNNDNSGRDRGDFNGKIYTKEDFIRHAEHFKADSTPAKDNVKNQRGFDLKIGSRDVNYYDYGEHLLRMMKRAITWEELNCAGRYVSVDSIDSIELLEPEHKKMTLQEFDNCAYDYIYGDKPFRYKRIMTSLKTEEEVVKALDENKTLRFYIGKLSKKRAA